MFDVSDPLNADTDYDFLLMGALEARDQNTLLSLSETLVSSGRLKVVKIFNSKLEFFGLNFNYPRNPHDLQYPLPLLILLEPTATPPQDGSAAYS